MTPYVVHVCDRNPWCCTRSFVCCTRVRLTLVLYMFIGALYMRRVRTAAHDTGPPHRASGMGLSALVLASPGAPGRLPVPGAAQLGNTSELGAKEGKALRRPIVLSLSSWSLCSDAASRVRAEGMPGI